MLATKYVPPSKSLSTPETKLLLLSKKPVKSETRNSRKGFQMEKLFPPCPDCYETKDRALASVSSF